MKMLSAVKLPLTNPAAIHPNRSYKLCLNSDHPRFPYDLHLPFRRLASVTVQSQYVSASNLSEYTESIGSPPSSSSHSMLQLLAWSPTQRHILLLNLTACAVATSAIWLFLSAIPTLLAFKRAAESLEKLMDATREELPDTMAAIRLSGMEISDLTMELGDLGQEITQGVRRSTRAVSVVEERLRRFTNMAPPASLQRMVSPKTEAGEPGLARTARGMKEGIVKGRAILQAFFTITRFSRFVLNYFAKRAKR